MRLNNLETGILFKNDKPHVKSIHAYFPSVVVLPDGALLGMYMLGEAFEATNAQVHLSRSYDQGRTWKYQGRLCPDTTDRITSMFGRVAINDDGELIANLIRFDRTDYPDQGLSNPETLGMVPADLLLMRSSNYGETWDNPEKVKPPLANSEFEMCSPITFLKDGRWVWPTSLWRDWEGNLPHGNRMVALVSQDRGVNWQHYFDVMHHERNHQTFWESKIVEFPDGRLLAIAWCYDEESKSNLPNQYSLSDDGGATWSAPSSTEICGQTLTPYLLDDGKILNIYRRLDQPGLWACMSRFKEGRWENLDQQPLWGNNSQEGKTATGENMSENFAVLKFGAPHITRLPDGDLFVTFWCYEQCVSVIRWFRFSIG
ncbi:sialidase family protein [Gimesia aquarii]|uniref:BNR/Asp-box repeat protein n=1 Tax=Gimesia aquarii TaxID=2527964 RepID=A0A517W098_9PLAN|nr:sialidase family protein [Gimesia aquarii]QDT98683.1 BNR/Asp-box repeat protein [Gimesia aquarii]